MVPARLRVAAAEVRLPPNVITVLGSMAMGARMVFTNSPMQ